MANKILTAERLRELYYYNPEAGTFENRKRGALAGAKSSDCYVLRVDGKQYLAHRLAWLYVTGDWPTGIVRHKNLCGTDNRWTNLIDASDSVNGAVIASVHRETKSGLGGVRPEGKRFVARICIGGKQKYLGIFDTRLEAHRAYVNAKTIA
jgi:hypothetical protein